MATAIAVGTDRSRYVTSSTTSTDLPTTPGALPLLREALNVWRTVLPAGHAQIEAAELSVAEATAATAR